MNTNAHRTIGQIAIARLALLNLAGNLLLLALPAVVQAQFTYTTNNGTITITSYTGPSGAVTIPSTINGLPVTSIGYRAFFSPVLITGITIPNSVTNIGDEAFVTCRFTHVTIPNSVLRIGDAAFAGCLFLNTVTLGNGITRIGHYTFGNTELSSITIPSSVTRIGSDAFDCRHFYEITVDALNSSFSSVAGVLFDKNKTTLITYPQFKFGSFTNPSTVTSIGEHAFYRCKWVGSFTIPNSVTNLGFGAFQESGLTGVTIPDSVTRIGWAAFASCIYLTNVMISDGVDDIGGYAFAGCTNLTSVTFGNAVTNIGSGAFDLCPSLTSVTIPSSVTGIEVNAFNRCTNLTGVYFKGNAPNDVSPLFAGADNAISYYLPGTLGWGTTFGGRPTAPWLLPNPVILTLAPHFGVQTNQFGFRVSWATNVPVVVETCTNLAAPVWSPLATNTLTGGWSYFSDPQWTNYPNRFYRVRSQ